ncbi:MAG: DUF3107 domain-containing protein [Propionibacteriaceae bacterium]|nr:DUF3107 domain-containing protein [Propionibacteriaceae bacterium]
MEVKVGIRQVAKEIVVESDQTADQLTEALREALSSHGLLTLRDVHGRRVLVPSEGIGYVELGAEHARPVGFGTI